MQADGRARALRSIVRVCHADDEWAMGVVALGNQILTAAHALPRLLVAGGLASRPVLVRIRPLDGEGEFVAVVRFADPCADIAVLGDSGLFGDDLGRDARKVTHSTLGN